MKIAAFDIGKKNFAFVIEQVDTDSIKQLQSIPKKQRYNKDGTPTPEFQEILHQLYMVGKVEKVVNLNLTYDCDARKYLDPKTFMNMINELDKYKPLLDECEVILIEKQMSFGKKKTNTMALKLGQNCYTYFLMKYNGTKTVLEYPAYYKTQVLGAPKKFGKISKTYKNGKTVQIADNRKKWAVRTVESILKLRGDEESLKIIGDAKKRDDMSDCLLMIITYSILHFVDNVF